MGYFLADIGMIFWFYPALGGMEYVSTLLFNSIIIQPALFVTKETSTFGMGKSTFRVVNSILRWKSHPLGELGEGEKLTFGWKHQTLG